MAAITPDMVCPKPHDFTPGIHPAVRESSDNIPFGSRPVRVQTVNANRDTKKCRAKPYRADIYENESAVLRD